MTDAAFSPLEILDFWWQAGPAKWFAKDEAFDAEIRSRFLPAVEAAKAGKLDAWETTPHGALALLILLDQFTRNLFRNDPRAFEADPRALAIADRAVTAGFDKAFPPSVRVFFYLPFEHAEDMASQERSVDLCRALNNEQFYLYALIHLDVIRRFGRFPHRNKVLGRTSTAGELAFLEDGGFSA
ncbi:DUF924 family protein [Roseibium suaedae]|uniref:Uncharacterized conserved protein, DUF924 family n=1 Tax=Roseibium suaedae TaxID=735517 RepID=A0A1M7N1W9_9HYPH|nr:DUF924 family protein [Roseibium suaedae]SHM97429.1 Uncharacterized conserved protein, DUF924 family [Roseibium suaedae]